MKTNEIPVPDEQDAAPPESHDERFDALCNNIGACVGNDDEIESLQTVATHLWQLLTPGQEAEFFADAEVKALETTAEGWAESQQRDLDPE